MVLGYFTMLSRVYITRYSIQATLICVGLGFLKSTSFHLEVRTMMQASVNIASVTSVGYQYLFQVLDTFRYQTMILILKNRYFSIPSFDTNLRYRYLSIDTSLRYFSIPSKYLKFVQAFSAKQIFIF